jgi:hypothetical protein
MGVKAYMDLCFTLISGCLIEEDKLTDNNCSTPYYISLKVRLNIMTWILKTQYFNISKQMYLLMSVIWLCTRTKTL